MQLYNSLSHKKEEKGTCKSISLDCVVDVWHWQPDLCNYACQD